MLFSETNSSDTQFYSDSIDSSSLGFSQDISSIPSCSELETSKNPWGILSSTETNCFITPNPSPPPQNCQELIEENIKLKRKVNYLEYTLKKVNSKKQIQGIDCSSFTESTNFLISQKPSLIDNSQNDAAIVRNLELEFRKLDIDQKQFECPCKRKLSNRKGKYPHKFFKLAFMSSIGTLKF